MSFRLGEQVSGQRVDSGRVESGGVRVAESVPEVRTSSQAHAVLEAIRPALDAPSAEWLRYYLCSARVYAEVAEIDRGHHHEAMYWADRERRKAEAIKRTGVHGGPGRVVQV